MTSQVVPEFTRLQAIPWREPRKCCKQYLKHAGVRLSAGKTLAENLKMLQIIPQVQLSADKTLAENTEHVPDLKEGQMLMYPIVCRQNPS